jgi:hypothetical protein
VLDRVDAFSALGRFKWAALMRISASERFSDPRWVVSQTQSGSRFVSKVNFMVKLLRACVWMPWRK